MLADFKYALRQFGKSPGFMAVAILILALGIGSTAAVFSVIDALLLKGLPIERPEELLMIDHGPSLGRGSYGNLENFRHNSHTLSDVVAVSLEGKSLVAPELGHDDAMPVLTHAVSGNFFAVLGVRAQLGRTLLPDDDRAGTPRAVVVLSHAFWQRAFAGDPSIVGKTVVVDSTSLTVVGVADPKFTGMEIGQSIDLWTPLNLDPVMSPTMRPRFVAPTASEHFWLQLFCRLRKGTPIPTAEAELQVLYKRELDAVGFSAANFGQIHLDPGGSGLITSREEISSLLTLLMAVVMGVLAVACANVASLVLARVAARQKEFALRMALGAGRWRLVRQLVAEGLILAAISAPLTLLFAQWGINVLTGYLPTLAGRSFHLDVRGIIFDAAVSFVAGISVGLLPALKCGDFKVMAALKAQSANLAGGSQRVGKALVAIQIALSVALLAEAGLFVRTLENLNKVDLGFRRSHLLEDFLMFDAKTNASQRELAADRILNSVQDVPGISNASFVWLGGGLMTDGKDWNDTFSVDGYAQNKGEPAPEVHATFIGPQFFKTMGIPVVRGSELSPADMLIDPTQPGALYSVVIGEAMARKFFGHRDPIGHILRLDWDETGRASGPKTVSFRIAGVAKDTRQLSLRQDGLFEAYLPYRVLVSEPWVLLPRGWTLEVRTNGDPALSTAAIHKAIGTADAKTRSMAVTTMDVTLDRAVFQEKITAQMVGYFSAFAIILAALGLYGVLAFNVARRTREIGVRMALGARTRSIFGLVIGEGFILALSGCLSGIAAAGVISHMIASRLYGVPPLDPLNFIATAAILLSVALLACWLPAHRATKVDPLVALRAE